MLTKEQTDEYTKAFGAEPEEDAPEGESGDEPAIIPSRAALRITGANAVARLVGKPVPGGPKGAKPIPGAARVGGGSSAGRCHHREDSL